jgi:transcriptional regulator with XRE-family HTH domain
MLGAMDDVALGRRFRALRHRLGWRQQDAGDAADVSQDTVSRTERGRIADVSVRALRRQAEALGGELRIELWFRGPELDRLLDAGHAALVGAVAARLEGLGWELRPEVSFAVFGERGSIDLLAWDAGSRILLVIEVKTELVSVEETLRRLDAKVRLAAGVARERFGWEPVRVARLLVLPDGTTARSQVRRHDAVLRAAFPVRGPRLRAWLRAPSGTVAALAFVPFTQGTRGSRPPAVRKRIRRPRAWSGGAVQGLPPLGHAGGASSAPAPDPLRTEDAGDA